MTRIAIISGITPNRATVVALLDAEEASVGEPRDDTLDALGLTPAGGGGASWDLAEVPSDTEVGERIWLR